MQECLIALGSNLPITTLTPNQVIEKAYGLISSESVEILRKSRLFSTPAFPPGAGPDFVNAAIVARTSLPPRSLLEHLHGVEAELGRTRKLRWEARVCDIDLLAFGDTVLPDLATYETWASLPVEQQMEAAPDQLILPHPRLAERGFVLAPLADVASDWPHPVSGITVQAMLDALPPKALEGITPLPA